MSELLFLFFLFLMVAFVLIFERVILNSWYWLRDKYLDWKNFGLNPFKRNK